MKVYVDLQKHKLNGIAGLAILIVMLAACVWLSLVLMKNPHKDLHDNIFKTANAVRTYYRDRPGYWKLSTESAAEDNLSASLSSYSDYDIQIGQGLDGTAGLPINVTFDITVKNLNKSACISLSEMKISKDNQLALQKITLINDKGELEFSWGGEHLLPIARYATREFCQPQNNAIMWTFQ